MSQDTPIVELADVTFGFRSRWEDHPILERVSLRVESSDFLGVIGPNGGGKTTLLQVILGLLKPWKGRVRVFGRPPDEVRHRIGYVPQQAHVDFSVPATVMDTVLMGRLAKSPWGCLYGREHGRIASEALHQTGIAHLADRPVKELSGGQFHRVLIARALAAESELLLLDEPNTAIDPEAQRELIQLLHQLNEHLPIILVSHDISFVSTHLKRVACLNRRLSCHAVQELTPELMAQVYHAEGHAIYHSGACPLTPPERDSNPGAAGSGDPDSTLPQRGNRGMP